MAQFYKRYRNLFIVNETPTKKSSTYLTPLKNQFKKRLESLKAKPDISTQNIKPFPANRFENEILPQLNKLNKKNQRYRLNTQLQNNNIGNISSPSQVYYSPQVSNKYKKSQENSNLTNLPTPRSKLKRSQLFRQRFYRLNSNNTNHHPKPALKIMNPQQQNNNPSKSLIQLQAFKLSQPTDAIDQKYYKTQPVEQVPVQNQAQSPRNQKKEQPRKGYGYPQINYGLVFSEYEKQNQFKMVDCRIRDIRWIQKYHPRGYINSYRQALVRRKQCKQKLADRRNRLKRLFSDEEKQYRKKRSII